MPLVNDVHSKLNPTRASHILFPRSRTALRDAVGYAGVAGNRLAVCGGRHAMGGQQFASNGLLVDVSRLNRVLDFDADSGLLRVQAGTQWPDLISTYLSLQRGRRKQWGIAQKQTGADRLSIGGAVASNIHGRGLTLAPLGQDVVAATVVTANADIKTISRAQNSDLFSHVLGGYGLFGAVADVTLKLHPRQKLRREVRLLDVDELPEQLKQRISDDYRYGDFQFDIDPESPRFLKRGIFTCYRPVSNTTPMDDQPLRLTEKQWLDLITLAHCDKTAAFEKYCAFYLATHGQIYWSDTHQLSFYLDDYHTALDELKPEHAGSEVITEVYVDLNDLPAFMAAAASRLRHNRADLIYGTVRLIERDSDSALPWATRPGACVVFNLHAPHGSDGQIQVARQQRDIIDLALSFGGRYFLTYHRCASDRQLLEAYPTFPDFLRAKRRYDPKEVFFSDWYAHYRHLADHRSAVRMAV